MKKLIILLCSVLAVGAVSGYMLANHSDMQVSLSKTLTGSDEEERPEKIDTKPEKFEVSFSKKKTFYDEDIEVELSCPDEDAVIFYTTNGNDPDEKAKRYTEPITIKARNKATATTIKAIAVTEENKSDIALKSYVTGIGIEDRFDDNTLVFILSTDEYNLYDYYNGIATEGHVRDEYLNSDDYHGGEIDYNAPANWSVGGRESERDMYVEVYTNKGEQLISQSAGARVVGGVSRANAQKSWRLIARNMYSDGKFKYPFFAGETDAYGNLITRYDRITLRDGANDREFAGVRDELSMTLSFEAGLDDVQHVRPAAVFLNSEYYGYSWLHEAYSNDYLEMKYGGNKDNFRIVGAKELSVEGDDEQCINDWNRVIELAESDLTQFKNFYEFCRLVDIDDLMKYYAIQIYIDNKDWPGNNYKAWRYYPDESETVTSKYLDGKWRFLLFDAEFGWGLYGNGFKDNTLSNVLTGNHMQGASHILRGLLQREDMREKFANTVCELIGGSFRTENVLEKLDYLISISDNEQMYALKNGYTSTWANEYTFADSRNQIRDFAEKRPSLMMKYIANEFGYVGDMYKVSLYNPSGAQTYVGSMKLSGSGKHYAEYFMENNVIASTNPYDGYDFDYWEVNGEQLYERNLIINAEMADEDKNISISLHLKRVEKDDKVVISELYTGGKGDWIEIYNAGSEPVDVKGYYLSDDIDNLERWMIPEGIIQPNGLMTIVCKNNNEASALMKHQTNFNLKTGETLYFSDKNGNILSEVKVVEMTSEESLVLGIDGKYHISIVTEGTHIEE